MTRPLILAAFALSACAHMAPLPEDSPLRGHARPDRHEQGLSICSDCEDEVDEDAGIAEQGDKL